MSPARASTPRYFGMRILMSWPRPASAAGKAPATSASPPVLANGSTSGAMKRMRNLRGIPSPSDLLEDRIDQRGHVRGDSLEVRQHVEMDLRRFERLGEALAESHQVRFSELALAVTNRRPL